jgi:hypothetical protein
VERADAAERSATEAAKQLAAVTAARKELDAAQDELLHVTAEKDQVGAYPVVCSAPYVTAQTGSHRIRVKVWFSFTCMRATCRH